VEDYPLEYYEFFVAFNEEDYYKCHDLLEEIWMTDKENLFIKGLLQMSVAIYHYSYGNVKGARSMMWTAYNYLQSYRPKHWGLDLEKVYPFIIQALMLFPEDIDSVPFEEIDQLPKLPGLYMYIEDSEGFE
jgi:predicted metal-dependent hydrolase